MGGALVPKHLFLILILALSFIPFANAGCKTFNGVCDSHSQDPNLACCSGLVCTVNDVNEVCKQNYSGNCPNGNDDCGSGLFCFAGKCKGCTCDSKSTCGGVACSSGDECCSGSCGGSPQVCKRCLGIGDLYQNSAGATMGACCANLVQGTVVPGVGGKCSESDIIGGSGIWSNIYFWAGLAVLMSASFLGLAYMASQLFRVQILEAWVRIELGELVKSMVIAVFCITLIATVNGAAQFLSGESGATDVISAAQQFMATLYGDAHALYYKLAIVYFNVAKVASYSYTAGTSLAGIATISYSSSPASGMSPLVSEVGQALDAVANYMLLAAAQAAFLKFFGTASLIMLPVGIFLRSFSFTRKLGATLLAATIASAVIYPTSVLLSQQVYGTFANEMKGLDASGKDSLGGGEAFASVRVKETENPPASNVVCNTFMQYFVQSPLPFLGGEIGWWVVVGTPVCIALAIISGDFIGCMTWMYQLISFIFMLVKAIFPILLFASVFITMENGTKPDKLLEDYYAPLHDAVLPAVAKFTVLSLVTFIIPLIITLSLLRGLATTFGGEAQLYGLSKLV